MEWLTTPRSERKPPTQDGLAKELNCHPRSIRVWMAREDFRADWDREAKNIVGSPERAKEVLDTLYRAAIDGTNKNQVAAAKLYLEATNSIKPQPIELKVTKPADLTDEELDALLAQGAAQLAVEREQAGAVIELHAERAAVSDRRHDDEGEA